MEKYTVTLTFPEPDPEYTIHGLEAVSPQVAIALTKAIAISQGWNIPEEKAVARLETHLDRLIRGYPSPFTF